MILDLEGKAKYINLGDWISYFTYGVFEHDFELKTFEESTKKITPKAEVISNEPKFIHVFNPYSALPIARIYQFFNFQIKND
jgi:hypothetical protein